MPNNQLLSDAQQRVLEYIITFTEESGYPPSVREITKGLGLKSTSTAQYHLSNMERLGLITHTPGIARSLRVTSIHNDTVFDALAKAVSAASATSEGLLTLSQYLSAFQKIKPMSVAEWCEYLKSPIKQDALDGQC